MKTPQTEPLPHPNSALPKSGVFDKAKGVERPAPFDQGAPNGRHGSDPERSDSLMTGEKGGSVTSTKPEVVEAVVVAPDAVSVVERRRSGRVRPKRPPLAPEIQAAVKAGARHKKVFGPMSREQSNAMVRAYHAGLVERRKPGRKPSELTLKVAGMLQAGMRWSEVFQELGFQNFDKYERTVRKDSLRRVVNAYMERNEMIYRSRKQTRAHNL